MTKTLLSSFTGGAIGTNPTTATETWASSAGGTEANMTYQAGIAGTSGQSVEVAGARDLVWTPSGSHWRLGMWINRASGAQTLGQACILLRSSTTNRADLFLRNQNGGQFALRAGSGGTTYAGQSATTIANGDVWWVELEYDNTDVTVYLWEPGNTTGTPDDTFTSTTAAAVDNVRLFNPTGSTGLTMRFGELWTSDGEQIRSGSGGSGALTLPALTVSGAGTFVGPPTLHYNLGGGPTADGFTVTARTSGASSCRIKASTTSDLLTSPVFSGAVSPDADGYVHISISGLSSGTKFYWGLEVDGELDTSMNGAVWTLTPSGTPTSIVFTSTSCHDWTGSTVFGLALTRFEAIESRIHVMLGDLGYPWITSSGTPVAPSDVAQLRAARLNEFEAANVMAFYRSRALSYTYSDGDGAGANSDGTWPGFTSNAVQTAYRQQVPLPDMPLADVQARSWVDGNWRFIQTDELTVASARGATDNSSKTKLGAAQKAWFKAELLAAKAARQSVIWLGDGPWGGSPSVGGTLQEWRAYNTERVELGNFIASNGMTDYLIRVHGDTHALAADDGTNNPYGGFAFISAAPFGTVAQVWGSTTTNGRWPDVSGSARQHGEYTLTDTGTTRTLVFSGARVGCGHIFLRGTRHHDIGPHPAARSRWGRDARSSGAERHR
ncbi:hypothetical protein FGL91_18600 [Microbacterium sp. CBA3102]|uniref:hypothetical protein n=1 Tax=Microbacterium sp. CBA3102 TaxID=2603598 RepID=UPI0011BB5D25|nr:hypothetical protein [Microbacterium sp. CBA3102]QEA30379.1 hypothetical protein FGL91_18600 [Microbacterium sp. CBA3102]